MYTDKERYLAFYHITDDFRSVIRIFDVNCARLGFDCFLRVAVAAIEGAVFIASFQTRAAGNSCKGLSGTFNESEFFNVCKVENPDQHSEKSFRYADLSLTLCWFKN